MINRGLFENAIRDAKRSKAELADSLGISRQSFYEKVNGVREFKQSEIATLTTSSRINGLHAGIPTVGNPRR